MLHQTWQCMILIGIIDITYEFTSSTLSLVGARMHLSLKKFLSLNLLCKSGDTFIFKSPASSVIRARLSNARAKVSEASAAAVCDTPLDSPLFRGLLHLKCRHLEQFSNNLPKFADFFPTSKILKEPSQLGSGIT